MKVFVTGATGFIGRHLVERLVQRGDEVVAAVRRPGHGLPAAVTVVEADIRDAARLNNAGTGCRRVYHLAALITFQPDRREELFRVNAEGTAQVLSLARSWGVERTIVVSSACTMGLALDRHAVLDETAPAPVSFARENPYMASKLAAEDAARAAVAQGQDVVIVNPTTVYGPGDRTLNSGTLVRAVARAAAVPVPPGGSNVVDVDDVVEGIIAAGERGKTGRRYILGGENLPFSAVLSTIAARIGRRPLFLPVPSLARMPAAAAARVAALVTWSRFLSVPLVRELFLFKYYSSALARKELGWSPRYAFPETVTRAWEYYQRERLL